MLTWWFHCSLSICFFKKENEPAGELAIILKEDEPRGLFT